MFTALMSLGLVGLVGASWMGYRSAMEDMAADMPEDVLPKG